MITLGKLAQKKQYLVVPNHARPADWPEGWVFPGPYPPGWPKSEDLHCDFDLDYLGGILTARCLDKNKEDTDVADGQMLHIGVFEGIDRCRMSADGIVYSETGLFLIHEYATGKWGIRQPIIFSCPRAFNIFIRLYGHEYGKWVLHI